jgi:uncharacterized protein YjbI with pentapeptide repeats
MPESYFTETTYRGIDFSSAGIPAGAYEDCRFLNCVFTGCNLSSYRFSDCEFQDCDLSNTVVADTALQEVIFRNCKLLGIDFSESRLFRFKVNFVNCQLNWASFQALPMKGTRFENCQLIETDFTQTNLEDAVFDGANLAGAVFFRTNLTGADFRTADNFTIDPEENIMKKAQFLAHSLAGLLAKYQLRIEGA